MEKLLKAASLFLFFERGYMNAEDKTLFLVFIFVGLVVAASLFALGIAIGAVFL